MQPAVGFIGVGQMGAGMVRMMLGKGHRVIVHDRLPEAVYAMVAHGAVAALSPRELADQAAIVFACLPTAEICNEVVFGSEGVAQGAAVRIYVEVSSVGPDACAAAAQALAAKGIAMVDMPVTGGARSAAEGTLTCILAGPDEAVNQVKPVIGAFARHVFVVGSEPGQGQACKLINSVMSLSAMLVASEAMAAGVKLGLDAQTLLDVINVSTGASPVTQDKFPRVVLPRTLVLGSHMSQCAKDMDLYLALCRKAGMPSLVGGNIAQLYKLAVNRFGAGADAANIVRLFEQMTGVEIAAPTPSGK